jgi:hypothetical protein
MPDKHVNSEQAKRLRLQRGGARALAFCTGLLAVALFAQAAQAQVKTYRYGKSGNWTVSALYSNSGEFRLCTARARYKSGTNVSINAYVSRIWSIQFYRKDWPKRPVTKFPATLIVDGRVVLRGQGNFRGRSAFVRLGQSLERVRAIMRGRVMTIETPSGKSSFRLDGTNRAARVVAKCWDHHRKQAVANNNSGAFGTAPPRSNNGAFGAPPRSNGGAFGNRPRQRANNNSSNKMSRSGTMEFAVRYLAKARERYEILSADKNIFKSYPVNWRYSSGKLGGMMIMNASQPDAEKGVQSQLSALARGCKGRSATERRPTARETGRRIARARGMCEQSGTMFTYDYTAAELSGNRLMLIVEGQTQRASVAPNPTLNPPPVSRLPRGSEAQPVSPPRTFTPPRQAPLAPPPLSNERPANEF